MICSVCGERATFLIRSEGMNERGIMVILAWADWDEISGGTPAPAALFCAPHASEQLARLPLLAPRASAGPERDTYTHG